MNVIECRNLTKAFGKTKALNNLSCQIKENRITGLIGRNGAGKTTLLKIIAGSLKPTSGEMRVFSESPFNSLKVSANMIFIHGQLNFSPTLNLKEILKAGESFYGNWDRELAGRLFEYFSFPRFQTYSGLSKGQKSTFNMILGLSARCPLTIFDEPTSGMDAGVRKDFYRAVLKEYIHFPRTILISSHHLNEIEDLLEDLLLIKDGKELLHMPAVDLKGWAIGIQGKTDTVETFLENKEVIYKKTAGQDHTYAVVKNHFSDSERENFHTIGIEAAPVTSSDLCIYLTSKTRGGIDDVFNKD